MKKLLFVTLTVLLAVPLLFAPARSAQQKETEQQAVHQAVLDYVEGVYNVDPTRIERSVHPELTKLGFYRPNEKAAYSAGRMSYEKLLEVAKTWNKEGKLPATAPKKITIFDVQDQTASAKLVAQWGTDYFHLAKYDGKWKIINVLWQSPPPKSNP